MESNMGLIEKAKLGLRSLKWITSKDGREYLKEQKEQRKGIENCCEHHHGEGHEHCEEKGEK